MAVKTLMMLALATAPATCEMAMAPSDKPVEASPAALAALPPGVDPGFLIKDGNGCYGIAIEVPQEGAPQTGPALLDATGQQVCDV
jgi:hypothetical protein